MLYSSQATETRGVTRTGKDGTYFTEAVPPGAYVVRVEGSDMLPVENDVKVVVGRSSHCGFQAGMDQSRATLSAEHIQRRYCPTVCRSTVVTISMPGELEPGVQVVDGRDLDPGKSGFQTLSINSQSGRTTHYDMDEVEVMDETKGLATLNLPAEAVREVIVSRATPELFQSLNATGAVRISTRSGGDEWHGNLFGNLRDRVNRAGGVSLRQARVQPPAVWIRCRRRADRRQSVSCLSAVNARSRMESCRSCWDIPLRT